MVKDANIKSAAYGVSKPSPSRLRVPCAAVAGPLVVINRHFYFPVWL